MLFRSFLYALMQVVGFAAIVALVMFIFYLIAHTGNPLLTFCVVLGSIIFGLIWAANYDVIKTDKKGV